MSTQLASAPLETQLWDWQGHAIAYTEMGEGRPLVAIHGFGASIGHWRKNIPILAAAGYKVFALDLLGFGASAKPAMDYSIELWQQQLQDFWRDRVGEPAIWVGNSIGGLLSLAMAASDPEMTAGCVLINCAGGLNHRPEELNLPLRVIMGTFSKVVSSPGLGRMMFELVRRPGRIRSSLYQVYGDRNAVTDELVDLLYKPSCDPGAHGVFASVLSAPPGPKPAELLPQLQCPLLVLWGDRDPWTPIAGSQIYQDLARDREDVEFFAIDGAGHCPHDECPEAVNARILQWLK
ncbi:MAG: alpha/beta fold hydrolase [Cyanobacteria bacterium J06641_5]